MINSISCQSRVPSSHTLIKWLETPFNGVTSKYDDSCAFLYDDLIGYNPFSKFSDYYNDDDIDMKCNASECILYTINDTFAYKNFNQYPPFIQMSLLSTEIYHTKEKFRYVTIFPGINHSHCSYLFKKMISLVIDNKMKLTFKYLTKNPQNPQQFIIKQATYNVLTVDDKKKFYMFCYLSTSNTKTSHENETNKVRPYMNISIQEMKGMVTEINEQLYYFNQWSEQLWREVLLPYLEDTNKKILSRVFPNVAGYMKFFEFLTSLDGYKMMVNIKNRLSLTLNEHYAVQKEKREKHEKQERQ